MNTSDDGKAHDREGWELGGGGAHLMSTMDALGARSACWQAVGDAAKMCRRLLTSADLSSIFVYCFSIRSSLGSNKLPAYYAVLARDKTIR